MTDATNPSKPEDPTPEQPRLPADAAPAADAASDAAVEAPADAAVTDARPTEAQSTEAPKTPTAEVPVAAAPAAVDDDAADETDDDDAEVQVPDFPRAKSNRLFGTIVVVIATIVFGALWIGSYALFIQITVGGSSVARAMQEFFGLTVWWVPIAVFFVLYEAFALIANRARGTTYVLGSLIIGLLVYGLNTLFYVLSAASSGSTVSAAGVFQVLESVLFILPGLLAREVVLWSGLVIGARGTRLRRRHNEAVDEYDARIEALAD